MSHERAIAVGRGDDQPLRDQPLRDQPLRGNQLRDQPLRNASGYMVSRHWQPLREASRHAASG